MERAHPPHLFSYRVILVFSLIILALFLAGHYYFMTEKRQIRADQQNQVTALTGIKVGQISAWLLERKAEGIFLASNPDFIRLMKKLAADPQDEMIQKEVKRWLSTIMKSHHYQEILITGIAGNPVLLISDSILTRGSGITVSALTPVKFPDSIMFHDHCSGGANPRFCIEMKASLMKQADR